MTSADERPTPGLRERKKAKTRAAIQHHAMRLFREQGYQGTTVEQIAEAAEISPSTFFRYFPTKEDVVLSDDYDPVLISTFRAQPAHLSPIQAIRNAVHETFKEVSAAEVADLRERMALILSEPELRAATISNMTQATQMLAELVAERIGRNPHDFGIRTFTGAVMGVWTSVLVQWSEDSSVDLITTLDKATAFLEAGLPL